MDEKSAKELLEAVFCSAVHLLHGIALLLLTGMSVVFVIPRWPLIGGALALIGGIALAKYVKQGRPKHRETMNPCWPSACKKVPGVREDTEGKTRFRVRKDKAARTLVSSVFAVLVLLLDGCAGLSTAGEKRARQDQQVIESMYRPEGERPNLPNLDTTASLHDFLLFAMLNHPQVEAAYFDWSASVQRITVERSLPDPRLTFESDISEMVMSLMPGLMMDFPGPGKLKAAANVATAESEAKYFAFENVMLQTAFALKKSYYELYFLDKKVSVNRESLSLAEQIKKLAFRQNEAGKVTLQDVLRAEIEQERIATEITNLEDFRNPKLAQFKAALGLKDDEPAPPIPQHFESTPLALTSDELFVLAVSRNPRLKAMEAEVRRADAEIKQAYTARIPDFSAGVEADLKASPIFVRPELSVTLPIWRDKIAAQIAAADAGKRAVEARLTAEQIALAVEFAEKSFMFREASRNLELLADRLLPKAQQSLEIAQSGYISSKVDFLNVLDAERTLLELRLSAIEAGVQRELALAELSLLIIGTAPPNAPIIPAGAGLEEERMP